MVFYGGIGNIGRLDVGGEGAGIVSGDVRVFDVSCRVDGKDVFF